MKIYVLVKQVPDTETNIKIDGAKVGESGVKWIVSPFDEHALEESLRLKDKTGGTITAVALGPQRCQEALRTAYALGVDNAVHIKDDSYDVLDVSYAAGVLASFLKAEGADIVLAGHIAIDSQSSSVPAMIAEAMGCANINNAIELSLDGDKVRAKREIEGGTAIMTTTKPVVVSAAKNLNDPRYPSLKGIMASKKKKIEERAVADVLGGATVPRITVVSLEAPPARPAGRVLDGADPKAKAAALVKVLREEAKVI